MLNQLAAADKEQIVKFAQFACGDEPDLVAKVMAELGPTSNLLSMLHPPYGAENMN